MYKKCYCNYLRFIRLEHKNDRSQNNERRNNKMPITGFDSGNLYIYIYLLIKTLFHFFRFSETGWGSAPLGGAN